MNYSVHSSIYRHVLLKVRLAEPRVQSCLSKRKLLSKWDLYITFLKPGIVTRRPLVLQLHKTQDEGTEYGEFLHLPRKKFYDFCKLTYLFSFPRFHFGMKSILWAMRTNTR